MFIGVPCPFHRTPRISKQYGFYTLGGCPDGMMFASDGSPKSATVRHTPPPRIAVHVPGSKREVSFQQERCLDLVATKTRNGL